MPLGGEGLAEQCQKQPERRRVEPADLGEPGIVVGGEALPGRFGLCGLRGNAGREQTALGGTVQDAHRQAARWQYALFAQLRQHRDAGRVAPRRARADLFIGHGQSQMPGRRQRERRAP